MKASAARAAQGAAGWSVNDGLRLADGHVPEFGFPVGLDIVAASEHRKHHEHH
jgi:hypothetical protein